MDFDNIIVHVKNAKIKVHVRAHQNSAVKKSAFNCHSKYAQFIKL